MDWAAVLCLQQVANGRSTALIKVLSASSSLPLHLTDQPLSSLSTSISISLHLLLFPFFALSASQAALFPPDAQLADLFRHPASGLEAATKPSGFSLLA